MTYEEEVWRTYPEFDFIEASNFGRVRTQDRVITCKNGSKRLVKGMILKQWLDKGGYLRVHFSVKGKVFNRQIHRIVASCFLPNPRNLPQINHKDCNRTNNNVNNLEWCTAQYNMAYKEKYGVSAKESTKTLRKPVFAVDLKTGEVLHFESQNETARQLKVGQRDIYAVLKGQKNTAGGYWFTEDESEITEEKIREIKGNMNFLGGVITVNLKTFKISYFTSQRESGEQLNIPYQKINAVLRGRQKTTYDHWFCYADSNAIEKVREKFGDEVASEVQKIMDNKQ